MIAQWFSNCVDNQQNSCASLPDTNASTKIELAVPRQYQHNCKCCYLACTCTLNAHTQIYPSNKQSPFGKLYSQEFVNFFHSINMFSSTRIVFTYMCVNVNTIPLCLLGLLFSQFSFALPSPELSMFTLTIVVEIRILLTMRLIYTYIYIFISANKRVITSNAQFKVIFSLDLIEDLFINVFPQSILLIIDVL